MVRNIVILGGNSHPQLVDNICEILGVPKCNRLLSKFSGGETRLEIQDSVRNKDVYIIETGSGKVNDHLIELCIMISACKIGSAKRITAVIPLFPYSRQPDAPYNKSGAPLSRSQPGASKTDYTFESVPPTPGPGLPRSIGLVNGVDALGPRLTKSSLTGNGGSSGANGVNGIVTNTTTNGTANGDSYFAKSDIASPTTNGRHYQEGSVSSLRSFTTHDYENQNNINSFQARPGYKQWIAQAGTLVADLLTCAGADHVISLELHDAQYQGFLDCPFDNLYGRPLLQRYIQMEIPNYKEAVIVSPDAGGAKRATQIADSLQMEFALIHKERRPTKFTQHRNATMMLVGDVSNRVCILIDDLADTANTITRAAKLLKKEGATRVYGLVTHGVLSGDAIDRVNASCIDALVVTNSVPQDEHQRLCPKLQVLDVSNTFAESIRRVHHGESISVLFKQY